ncbi:MAG TPA: hypothetical protein VNW06_04865 [Cytophagaceae bacterium]|jgi:hypothetical protein|nr:hypothetical protein [Cytophagaceae bacterium]
MKNLFAFAFVACSLVLVSCGEKSVPATKDTVVSVAPMDSTPVAPADTTPVVAADTTKKEEVKK